MFAFEIEDDNIKVKKYLGKEAFVTVPEQEEGIDIKVIGRYAFAENRQLQEIILPNNLLKIDRHAFYNCRNLKQISVPGSLTSIEDGAFKNCEKLSIFILREAESGNTCLKHLLYDQNHAVKVMIHYKKAGMSCLYFPSYEYEYIANEPARIFNEVGYGAGYLYQQCFFNKDVDYKRYDSVFSSAIISETIETLFYIALLRLKYPYQLSASAKEVYCNYITKNLILICMILLEENKWEELYSLEELQFFTEDKLQELIEEARKRQLFKGLAWFMDYKKKHSTRKQEEFLL